MQEGGRAMMQTRTLRFGSKGEDVLRVKQRLLALCCYAPHITQVTTSTFGRDTQRAVELFQAQNALLVDGIVGPLTFGALFHKEAAGETNVVRDSTFPNLGAVAISAILPLLEQTGEKRRTIVLDALQFAFDPAVPRAYPLSLYIRGGNLYNADLTPNVISLSRIQSGAKRQPEFYDGGRQEMMEDAVRQNPATTGADCSGGVVGLLRHAGVVKPTYDLAADGFEASGSMKKIEPGELLPADLLHKSGHIGLYVGGGYSAEWMGGAYGCQLTKLTNRRGWNFVKHTNDRFGAWTSYLRPSWY